MTELITTIKLPPLEKESLQKLNQQIDFFLDKQSIQKQNIRKAIITDFLTNPEPSCANALPPIQYEKPKHYRIQDEYGEKKFIKP